MVGFGRQDMADWGCDVAAGFGRQDVAEFRGQDVSRNVEENRGTDVEQGHHVGYHVGNLCSEWNRGKKCRYGIKCKWQHRCSKLLNDGTICKNQWHTEKEHCQTRE